LLFSKPFPREQNLLRTVRNAFLGGLLVIIFLRVFEPFGFGQAPVSSLNLFALGYGLVTVIVLLSFVVFEAIFPDWFTEEKWTVGKNILLYIGIVFFIGTANFYYTAVVTGMPLNLLRFISFQLFTLAVTFVIASFLTMLKYFSSLKHFQSEAMTVEKEVAALKPFTGNNVVEIISENDKENFTLALSDLYYIESADNYSKFVFNQNGKTSSKLIRSSLKRLEDQFTHSELFRCHRSYIVQLRNVERVTGNSQGYKLHLKDLSEQIPVSRSAGEKLHERLQQISTH
jgi:DNA-binding LytR/AlgR family response regulator